MLGRLQWGLALLLAIGLFGAGPAAHAQSSSVSYKVGVCDPKYPNNCSQGGPFVPDAVNTASLAVTAASGRVALPGLGQTVLLLNNGSVDLYVKLGGATVGAATTDFLIGTGRQVSLARGTNTYVAAITASGSSTLIAQTGNGNAVGGGGGGGGGGGAATIADGADVTQGAKADAPCATAATTCSVEQRLAKIEAAAEDTTTESPVKIADGSDVSQGAKADAACGTDTGTCSELALLKRAIQRLTTLITATGSPFQAAGTIGNFPSAVDTNTGAAGASTVRVIQSSTPAPVCTSVLAINQATSTDLLTSVAKLHICSVVLVSSTAQAFSLIEGTGTVCATGAAALIGATTADSTHGVQAPANGGFSAVAGVPWLKSKTTADHLCLVQSSTGIIAGIITYADAS